MVSGRQSIVRKKRTFTVAAIAVGLVIAVGLAILMFAGPWLFFKIAIFNAQRAQVRLLSKTDFESLLRGGREVLSQISMEPNTDHLAGSFPVPSSVEIPTVVRRLRPQGLAVNYDGFLVIRMHGAMDNFGVFVYPEGFQKPYQGFAYGDRKLIDGLWYYDGGNYNPDTDYGRTIDALIAKRRTK
jgi:hypothetical protein